MAFGRKRWKVADEKKKWVLMQNGLVESVGNIAPGRGLRQGISKFHAIMARCRAILPSIANSKMCFERMQANNVAHILAKTSLAGVDQGSFLWDPFGFCQLGAITMLDQLNLIGGYIYVTVEVLTRNVICEVEN
ncbi:hypothetical protein JHK82_048482 [Glycine max]|nr:hypothetical protein JHK85_048974 [Glycine max]KAG5098628.1 hypothetical protein JHK82_048482 [Glycine max]KAG5103397.1 hypothetical protein JHK84_048366 [Glycine max]